MMFGGGGGGRSSGSSSGGGGGGGGRETHHPGGGSSSSSYPQQHQHHMSMNINMNMLLPPPPFPPQQLLSPTASIGGGSGGGFDDDDFPKRDERAMQWGIQETRDFIAIRAELEGEFAVAKRNKALWEVVAAKMKDLGYRRNPDQCKCKWKNLVNRYKGKETSDLDEGHQIPFFAELHAVFTATANHMQQSQVEFEAGSMQSSKRAKKAIVDESSEELLENDDGDGDGESDEDKVSKGGIDRKRKVEKEKKPRTAASGKSPRQPSTPNLRNSGSSPASIPEILRNYFQQQQRIEMEWRESMEKRGRERELFEHEWRQTMEKLERERMTMEQAWREREEQRRVREEIRAEKRDSLLTILLNKLIQEKHT